VRLRHNSHLAVSICFNTTLSPKSYSPDTYMGPAHRHAKGKTSK
jgi:hypothetical protein